MDKALRDGALIARCKPIGEYEIAIAPPADDAVLTMDEHLAASQRRIAALRGDDADLL
jgi:hypothetical protein